MTVEPWRRHFGRRAQPPSTEDAVANAHLCPVRDCHTLVSPGHVSCRTHWRAVPQELRDPLVQAFRLREQQPGRYAAACATAAALVCKYAGQGEWANA